MQHGSFRFACSLAALVAPATTRAQHAEPARSERYEIVERMIGSDDYHRLQRDIPGHISAEVPGTVVFRRTVSIVPNMAVDGTRFGTTTWHAMGRERMGLKEFGVTRFRDGDRYLEYRDAKAPYPRDLAVGVRFRMDGIRESTIYPGPRRQPQTYLMLTVRSLP